MSTLGEDWDKARTVVEPAIDEVAKKVRAAGVDVGVLGGGLIIAGVDLVTQQAGPGEAVRLLEGLIETLEAPSKRPDLQVVGGEGEDSTA